MIDFSNVKLYIFDLQQTLLNDFEAHLQAHKTIFGEIGVEDVQAALMEAAKNGGIPAIGVLTGFTKREKLEESGANLVVQDLTELHVLMKQALTD